MGAFDQNKPPLQGILRIGQGEAFSQMLNLGPGQLQTALRRTGCQASRLPVEPFALLGEIIAPGSVEAIPQVV